MPFEIDKQTIEDLNIYNDDVNIKSIANLFDQTQCFSGKNKVHELLNTPLSDYEELNARSQTIQFFCTHQLFDLHLNVDAIGFVEYYQKQRRNTIQPHFATAFCKHLFDKLNNDAQYFLMETGVNATIELLKWLNGFIERLTNVKKTNSDDFPLDVRIQMEKVIEIYNRNGYDKLIKQKKIGKYLSVGKLDYQFRIKERRDILFCLDLVHKYDAFSTIAKVAHRNDFTFANVCKSEETGIEIEGLYHPLLDRAISNDLSLTKNSNLLFLSGPNMGGKSTLLKALATAVYLAHVGFPVPATKMKIGVLSGLCTTINIADDLSSGYSHFYAEVMRIKRVALKLKEKRNMLILFDELFRGTNVKDAYDGTSAVIKAFAEVKDAHFVISTHIVEVAEELKDIPNIRFGFMGIEHQKNGHPVYSYKLKEGVSKDRLGLYIIEQEGIINLINEINKK